MTFREELEATLAASSLVRGADGVWRRQRDSVILDLDALLVACGEAHNTLDRAVLRLVRQGARGVDIEVTHIDEEGGAHVTVRGR